MLSRNFVPLPSTILFYFVIVVRECFARLRFSRTWLSGMHLECIYTKTLQQDVCHRYFCLHSESWTILSCFPRILFFQFFICKFDVISNIIYTYRAWFTYEISCYNCNVRRYNNYANALWKYCMIEQKPCFKQIVNSILLEAGRTKKIALYEYITL